MLRIEFEGNAEEILHDMQLLLGARVLQKKEPKAAEPETVKTASPVAEASKKAEEKPAKKELAKSPEEHKIGTADQAPPGGRGLP